MSRLVIPLSRLLILSILSMLTVSVVAGCGEGADESETSSSNGKRKTGLVRSQELPPAPAKSASSGPLNFLDVTHDAGIRFRNETGSEAKLWIVETIGQGVMCFDYDNDGDLDLYFANGKELRTDERTYWNALYRNEGDFTFTDVTEGSGLECPDWSIGVYYHDFDADGFDDVFVAQLGANKFLRNIDGTGRFEDVTDKMGGGGNDFSTSAAFFDADDDGDLDLYVCNYVLFDVEAPPNEGRPCEWKGLPVACGPRGLPEAIDRFYEFRDGRYVEATEKFGFLLLDRDRTPRGAYSLGVVVGDYDLDGDSDVYVAVDSRPNLMFENLGGGRFKETASQWSIDLNAEAVQQAGMGVTSGDLDQDGRPDLFVTNFSHDTNTLYINAGRPGNMYFTDDTSAVGLGHTSYSFLSWGCGINDFNCDGFVDIFVASGHVYPQTDDADDLGSTFEQPNQLFISKIVVDKKGRKKLEFANHAPKAGSGFAAVKSSRSTCFADFDQDGRIDIVVQNLDEWPTVIRNASSVVGGWIGFSLRSRNPANRYAINAVLQIELDNGEKLRRELLGGGGYLGANSCDIHFGLGKGRSVKKVEITWPDGKKQIVDAPVTSRYHTVTQDA